MGFFGKEDAATKRFLDARKSGFKGPIDRNGRCVMTRTDSKGKPVSLFGGGKKNGKK